METDSLNRPQVDGEKIRAFLAQFASFPHMAGQIEDEYLAVVIKDMWLGLGLDQVWHRLERRPVLKTKLRS
jgi:hypothetical protein